MYELPIANLATRSVWYRKNGLIYFGLKKKHPLEPLCMNKSPVQSFRVTLRKIPFRARFCHSLDVQHLLYFQIKDGEEQSANVLALTYPSTNESVVPNVVPQKLLSKTSGDQAENVRKLERQIIFLKEEHQSMLRALQIEVDLLKQKNKGIKGENWPS